MNTNDFGAGSVVLLMFIALLILIGLIALIGTGHWIAACIILAVPVTLIAFVLIWSACVDWR